MSAAGDARDRAHYERTVVDGGEHGPGWFRRAGGLFGGAGPGEPEPGDPGRAIRIGLVVTFAFFVLFLGWAAVARLDAGTTGQGFVVVAGNRKAVQHREGGIVNHVYVREGDTVKAGQVLISLADDEVRAKERSTSSQVIGLKAYKARLAAEIEGRPTITFPAEFQTMTGADAEDARINMRMQEQEFAIRRRALATEKQVLRQRVVELQHQVSGGRAQASATGRQGELIRDELVGIRDLERQGYVAMSRVRELERSEAQYRGAEGEYQGEIAKGLSSIGETSVQMVSLDKNQAADSATQYREADMKLADLEPQLASLRAELARTVIRAPVGGQIVGLKVFTNGGVVAPGDTLMEVVPQNDGLVIRARVDPNDVDGLYIGQRTEIRIPAFHNRGLPILNGQVTKISADKLVDQKTDKPYFEIEVSVPASELKVMRDVRGSKTDLIAGLPVEVVILQRKRTALNYLFEPIHEALWRSFREH